MTDAIDRSELMAALDATEAAGVPPRIVDRLRELADAGHAAPIDLVDLQVELHPLVGQIDDVAGKAVAIAGRLGGTVYLVFNGRRIEVRHSGMTPRMVADHYWSLVDRGEHRS